MMIPRGAVVRIDMGRGVEHDVDATLIFPLTSATFALAPDKELRSVTVPVPKGILTLLTL